MFTRTAWLHLTMTAGILATLAAVPATAAQPCRPVFSCKAENDLYRVLAECGMKCPRYVDPAAAVEAAPRGAGVLLLADAYPHKTQSIDAALFDQAARKRLRLYVEYPASLPGVELEKPRNTRWERGVITSEGFGPKLRPMRIVAIHDCHFVPLEAEKPHLVIAKVAGFDTAVYGLPKTDVWPILFEQPGGQMLVSTTKLSQFLTARYAPTDAWAPIMRMILGWVEPELEVPELKWTPTVRPSYSRDEPLPADAEREAVRRGNDWVLNARMLIDKSWHGRKFRSYDERFDLPPGDGSAGILEGFASRIRCDGSQPVRWNLRTDCTGEHVAPFVLAGRLLGEPRYTEIGRNLADFVLFKFDATAPWSKPSHPAHGLIGWACPPTMAEPVDQTHSFYGVIDARICLSTLAAAGALDETRWDDRLLQVTLANFRTTGRYGLRPTSLRPKTLEAKGWQYYHTLPHLNLAPMPTAQLLALNLAAYRASGYRPLLERTRQALRILVEAYPKKWRWWNGLQQERARLILPLAWLVRVDDTPEHRAWLARIAGDLLDHQMACGAVREELGEPGQGIYPAPPSNEAYGTTETPLLQENGDPVCDLLYTLNSAFIGLHEAAAATGDPKLRQAEDRLAAFLCRIQTRSREHPELDGTWFRAFDFGRWDYWASNADLGWGAWSVETGWVQGWIVTTLALRQRDTTLWELATARPLDRHLKKNLDVLMPKEELDKLKPAHPHAALDRPVRLANQPTRGPGAPSLIDGRQQEGTALESACWLAFHDADLEATVDLGRATSIHTLAAHFLQEKRLGIFLPERVEFSLSDNGQSFHTVAALGHDVPKSEAGPLMRTIAADKLKATGRYVRVRAKKTGTPGRDWLFVDEILVNPEKQVRR